MVGFIVVSLCLKESLAMLTWGRMKQITLRRLLVDLADVENDRIHLKRNTPLEKDLHDNLDYHEGLVFTYEYENTA